jgi:hypothetical protein
VVGGDGIALAFAVGALAAVAEAEVELRRLVHVLPGIEAECRELDVLEDRVRRIDEAIAQQVGHRYRVQARTTSLAILVET